MNISEIKIRKLYTDGRLRALVSITVDEDFAIHDIKVIEGPNRIFVAMPSRREPNGAFRDIAHPISAQSRQKLEEQVLCAYKEAVKDQGETEGERLDSPHDPNFLTTEE